MKETLSYYDKNAAAFCAATVQADMGAYYAKFMALLPVHARVLDCGCGSGRDSRYFLEQGCEVVAMDGSAELCRLASAYTGLAVQQLLFQDIAYTAEFDGIWACASLLHVPMAELPAVFAKLYKALRSEGVLYASFKYGTFAGERKGRYFTDLDEAGAKELLVQVEGLQLVELWQSEDVREEHAGEMWLNLLERKIFRKRVDDFKIF